MWKKYERKVENIYTDSILSVKPRGKPFYQPTIAELIQGISFHLEFQLQNACLLKIYIESDICFC